MFAVGVKVNLISQIAYHGVDMYRRGARGTWRGPGSRITACSQRDGYRRRCHFPIMTSPNQLSTPISALRRNVPDLCRLSHQQMQCNRSNVQGNISEHADSSFTQISGGGWGLNTPDIAVRGHLNLSQLASVTCKKSSETRITTLAQAITRLTSNAHDANMPHAVAWIAMGYQTAK